MGSFYPKYKMYELKPDMRNDAKFEQELICHFKIDIRNLTNFDPSTKKAQKCAL